MDKSNKLKEIIKKECLITGKRRKIIDSNGNQCSWMFDIKRISMDPVALDLVVDIFWSKSEVEYPFQVGGQESAAIPFIVAIIQKGCQRGKPINGFYMRKERKCEGLQNIIEGKINEDKIILIDDVINSGNTINQQTKVIENESKKVHAVFTLVRFRDLAKYNFLHQKGICLISLFACDEFGVTFFYSNNNILENQFTELWLFRSPDPELFYVVPKSTPNIDEKNIYFGSDKGIFWALDQKNGQVLWQFKIARFPSKGIFSSPAIHKKCVYFGAYDGNLYCLDCETGQKKWVFQEADWIGSSPVIASDLEMLFIGLEFGLNKKHGGIAAINPKTGKKIWEYKMREYVHCSPAYCGEKKLVAIGGNDNAVYLFRATDGKLLWRFECQGKIKSSLVFDIKRNAVIFGSMDGQLYILDISSGQLKNSFKTGSQIFSTPLIYGDKVIFTSMDKVIYCLNLDGFKTIWTFRTAGRILSSPKIIENHVFFGSNDGRMYELDPTSGNLISSFQTTEKITNGIIYNETTKFFFVSTYANEIYCLARSKSVASFQNDSRVDAIKKDPFLSIDMLKIKENESISKEDIELVRLAKDAVTLAVLSNYKKIPLLTADGMGSFGYLPFMGEYMVKKGSVFIKITKREFKDGAWINRLRGCMSNSAMSNGRTYAENTIDSALLVCTKPRKTPSVFHKPIWAEEIGSLSFFVYIVEKIEKTEAKSAQELEKEGHNPKKHGLMIETQNYKEVLLGGLDVFDTTEKQLQKILRKMSNEEKFKAQMPVNYELFRIYGRWLWLPERPRMYYFNHI